MKKLIQNFKTRFNYKDFFISMIIFFAFYTFIAAIMLISGKWKFDNILLIFYGCGLIISGVINFLKFFK